MDWKEKLEAVKDSGQKIFDQKSDTVIHEHWPKVQALFQEKVGPAALKAAKDDKQMDQLFKGVYKALPFPINVAVKEDAFVKFCFAHRNELLPPAESQAQSA